jgi:hypothetical protein
MNKVLSDQQMEQFHEQGFLAGLRVWDDNTVERAQSHFRQVTQVIPGSHKKLLEHGAGTRPTDVLNLAVHSEDIDDRNTVDIVLKAGEMSLHTDAVVHGSHAKDSDHRRRGMTMRIGTPDVSVDLAE